MSIKIKLHNEVEELFRNLGSVAIRGENDYLYFPFWIKKNNTDGSAELIRLGNLPDDLREIIIAKRNELITPIETLNLEVDAEEVKA